MQSTPWAQFRQKVAETVHVELENLDINEMSWSFQKKLALLLTCEEGYKVMLMQLKSLKDPLTAIILVYLPVPKAWQMRNHDSESAEDVVLQEEDNSQWGKKVGYKQREANQTGAANHSLDKNRLKVWANAILWKVTNHTKPPLGSNFFLPKDSLKIQASPSTPGPSPGPSGGGGGLAAQLPWSQPNFWPGPYGTPPHLQASPMPMPWGGYMSGPVYLQPPPPYNHPYTPTPAGPPPYYHGSLTESPQAMTGALGSCHSLTVSLADWCADRNLDETEEKGLTKLGFKVGDSLATLSMDVWEWAGLGPLHRNRILIACGLSVTPGNI
ncbi:hypothetical protein H0H81_003980 [Sphagnurus paluster]|uniref:Uncharacterized protein n=1 Tax=Sphagnurus paluster TaxID=117069 RepID=A0A9P7FNX8_9AGAR|nr:hypothetical protein H0H81_003980 [Sphagnurus paluster]